MIGSFQDLANKNRTGIISPQMLEYFNSTLPEGFEYRVPDDNKEMCQLISTQGKNITISDSKVILTDKQKEMLGDAPVTAIAVEKLINNALEEVRIDISEADLKLGKVARSTGYLIRTVDDNHCAAKGYCCVFKEPLEFNLPLLCGDAALDIHCVQRPSGSIGIKKFESVRSALRLTLEFNEFDKVVSYKFNFDNCQESNAERCRDAAILFDGLGDGSTEIQGFGRVNLKSNTSKLQPIAPFWESVVAVQEALGVSFDTSALLDRDTIINVTRLNKCIVEGKAVGLGYKPDSITVTTREDLPSVESPCRLVFPGLKNLTVFGRRIEVHVCIGLSGIVLGSPEKITDDKFCYPVSYLDEYLCSILYLATDNTNDTEENVAHISDVLFTPLSDGARY